MIMPGRPLLGFLLALPLLAAPALAQTPERPPVRAGYMTLERAEVPVTLTLTGRAVAANTAQIRPRVSGMVREILYTPGTYVEAGTPLFRLDPITYEISLQIGRAHV